MMWIIIIRSGYMLCVYDVGELCLVGICCGRIICCGTLLYVVGICCECICCGGSGYMLWENDMLWNIIICSGYMLCVYMLWGKCALWVYVVGELSRIYCEYMLWSIVIYSGYIC